MAGEPGTKAWLDPSEAWLWDSAAPDSGLLPPSFAVARQMASGIDLKHYDPEPVPGQTAWTFGPDGYINQAKLTYDGSDRWTLVVQARSGGTSFVDGGPANQVWFPCRDPLRSAPLPAPLGIDARVYYFYQGGLLETEKHSVGRGGYTWGPMRIPYPGGSCAPVLIVADGVRAELIAAINDPPQLVDMRHSGGQTAFIFYPTALTLPTGATLRVLISEVRGDAAAGYHPWQLALQRYKSWLDVHFPSRSHPSWMENGEGFISVGLQDNTSALKARDNIDRLWSGWKDHFGWIQFWGQMSNYAGPASAADPPLMPGEQVGCCLPNSTMHARYLPWLADFAAGLHGAGYRAGFYSAPFGGPVDQPAGKAYLDQWLDRNGKEYGARAFYIDIIGNTEKLGDPQSVRDYLDTVPPATVIEHWVDVYPRPPLLSGYLVGIWPGGPTITPAACDYCTFINLSRFLMGDRIGYLGEGNGEHVNFGPGQNYWLERQIFLLGAKAEVYRPDDNYDPSTPNPYLLRIKRLHDETKWWKLKPRYIDTVGLTNVPSGIDARRFAVGPSQDLVAIDNPGHLTGQHLNLKGRPLAIPSTPLSVIKVDAKTGKATVHTAP